MNDELVIVTASDGTELMVARSTLDQLGITDESEIDQAAILNILKLQAEEETIQQQAEADYE